MSAATQHQPAPRLLRRLVGGGLPYGSALVCTLPMPTPAAGAAAMRHLLPLAQPPNAVFSSYDLPVLETLEGPQARQTLVPQQVALVGFSHEPFTTLVRPQLASVEQRGEQMGKAAVRLLLQMRKRTDGFRPQRILIKPQLLVRDSSRKG